MEYFDCGRTRKWLCGNLGEQFSFFSVAEESALSQYTSIKPRKSHRVCAYNKNSVIISGKIGCSITRLYHTCVISAKQPCAWEAHIRPRFQIPKAFRGSPPSLPLRSICVKVMYHYGIFVWKWKAKTRRNRSHSILISLSCLCSCPQGDRTNGSSHSSDLSVAVDMVVSNWNLRRKLNPEGSRLVLRAAYCIIVSSSV